MNSLVKTIMLIYVNLYLEPMNSSDFSLIHDFSVRSGPNLNSSKCVKRVYFFSVSYRSDLPLINKELFARIVPIKYLGITSDKTFRRLFHISNCVKKPRRLPFHIKTKALPG